MIFFCKCICTLYYILLKMRIFLKYTKSFFSPEQLIYIYIYTFNSISLSLFLSVLQIYQLLQYNAINNTEKLHFRRKTSDEVKCKLYEDAGLDRCFCAAFHFYFWMLVIEYFKRNAVITLYYSVDLELVLNFCALWPCHGEGACAH